MKHPSDFAICISSYLTKHLAGTRNLSSNTIKSYRDTFCSPLTGVTSDSWDTQAGHRVYDACRGFSVPWGSGASSASSTSC